MLISFTPILVFFIIINGRFVSGKHLLYYTPFLALVPTYFLHLIFEKKNKQLISVVAALFVGQYIIGYIPLFIKYPYFSNNYSLVYSSPKYVQNKIPLKGKKVDGVEIVLGSGLKLATSDEMLLSSGIIFSPIMWFNLKVQSGNNYNLLATYLRDSKDSTLLITTSQGGIYPLKNLFYTEGFVLQNSDKEYSWGHKEMNYVWKNKSGKVILLKQDTYPKDFKLYQKKLHELKLKRFIHVAFWDWEKWFVHQDASFKNIINDVAYLYEN